jgi:hypothetical protein
MRRSIGRTLLQGGAAAVLALASFASAGCGDDSPTTPTTPTTPAPVTVTETFSGELRVNGAATYPFIVISAGTTTVQLTAVDPGGSPSFGLSLGTWNGAACQVVIANDSATLNSTVTGNVSAATTLCARVYDAGRLTGPLTYTISVVHP